MAIANTPKELTPRRLKAWRQSLLLSQQQLAEKAGKDVSTISRWERGIREIDPQIWYVLKLIEQEAEQEETHEPV